jgi:rubrerythrin
MTRELTGYEVLDIAEKMGRNAAGFYGRAAGMYDDPKISRLFSELAQWEKRHTQIFAEMKEHLSGQTWELGQYGAERPKAPAPQVPTTVFGDRADPSRELTGDEAKADVLRRAIQKEKDTIAYYTSLKEFVLGDDSVEAIKEIIREEDRHVRILTQSLEQIA